MPDTDDKRASGRFPLDNFQRIRDAESGQLMGYLGDISSIGIRMLGKDELPIGERFHFRIVYFGIGGEKESPVIEVESLWNRDEDNMPYRETGFRYVDPGEETMDSLERIIEDIRQRTEERP